MHSRKMGLKSVVLAAGLAVTSANAADCAQIAGCRFANDFRSSKRLVLKIDNTFTLYTERRDAIDAETEIYSRAAGTWSCADGAMVFNIGGQAYTARLSSPSKLGSSWKTDYYLKDKTTPVIQFGDPENLAEKPRAYRSPFASYYHLIYDRRDDETVCR